MEAIAKIPKILIYEEFDGHPIYRKGYRDFMLGLKKIEDINMGTSTLQWFITNAINKYLFKTLPDGFLLGSGELGLHIAKNTNFSADIAIYREGVLQVGFHSVNYTETPPSVVIEVDIKIDESDYFQNEEEYFHKKTEQLLQWGVERVIWVFSASRRVLIADNPQTWAFNSWDLPLTVIDNHEMNIWDLMLKNGFQV
ncbi:MAG: Uma2 family endonuclease [Cytophagia bacterium]|nr:MAG: Uma2 family endonuclease [Runella sp.]TAG21336.1 MAG: Uma2 family endonuclease [Cytophagales bacterium]TAG40706.1 MAG: Uma2 family endonuclease [Cytophagia bacterium]TAG82083.1 MAG: Uma2 family endonuclease [Cytophagales bacterium]